MVQSKALTVDDYMDEVAPERLDAVRRLRSLCLEHLTGWSERMAWGMPGYGPVGADPTVAFSSQKQYISLYAGQTAVQAFAEQLRGINCGKGCIRYSSPARIDFAVVEAILKEIRARNQPMC
ncbi:MAG: DUF1801 domain-containing protein [Caulobacter sp.]|nr:DUF1801 domain-containing protein [Caulobacter sp.]